jgi:hypothetical protein
MVARRIECKITDSLLRFKNVLNRSDNTQQQIHDCLFTLKDGDCLSDEDSQLISEVLNAFLSLTFTLKANPEEIERFIEYYD